MQNNSSSGESRGLLCSRDVPLWLHIKIELCSMPGRRCRRYHKLKYLQKITLIKAPENWWKLTSSCRQRNSSAQIRFFLKGKNPNKLYRNILCSSSCCLGMAEDHLSPLLAVSGFHKPLLRSLKPLSVQHTGDYTSLLLLLLWLCAGSAIIHWCLCGKYKNCSLGTRAHCWGVPLEISF